MIVYFNNGKYLCVYLFTNIGLALLGQKNSWNQTSVSRIFSNWKLPILKKSVKLDSFYFRGFRPGLFLTVWAVKNLDFGISIIYIFFYILSWSTTVYLFFTGVTTTNGSSALIAKGPDEDKIKEILNRTGYKLDVTTGQRKYGGPPPNWEGDPPASGCEVSIQQIFPEINFTKFFVKMMCL